MSSLLLLNWKEQLRLHWLNNSYKMRVSHIDLIHWLNQKQKRITSWLILYIFRLINKKNRRGINKASNQTDIWRQQIRITLNKMPLISPAITAPPICRKVILTTLQPSISDALSIVLYKSRPATAAPASEGLSKILLLKPPFSKHKTPSVLRS